MNTLAQQEGASRFCLLGTNTVVDIRQDSRNAGPAASRKEAPSSLPPRTLLAEFLRDSRFLPFVFIYFSRRRKFIPRRVARFGASFYLAANIEIYLYQIHDERSLVDTNVRNVRYATICICVCV